MKKEKCSIIDCEDKSICLTWCNKHYHRFYRHGDPLYTIPKSRLTSSNKVLHNAWASMKKRCYNSNNSNYVRYGGRGIKVCNRWLGKDGFKNFLEDMGERPTSKHSIDRINNDGNYEPSNCRWATSLEQELNKGIPKNNKTGIKGVCFDKRSNKYYVTVTVNRKTIPLGFYTDIEDARKARKQGELKYYGKVVQ